MVFLSDVEEGGETYFPRVKLKVQARRGRAVIWRSLKADGTANHNSLHAGLPVIKGDKTILTKWFRAKKDAPVPAPVPCRGHQENTPNYTKLGFKKMPFAHPVLKKLNAFYSNNRAEKTDEFVPGELVYAAAKNQHPSHLLELPDALKLELHKAVQPCVEQWVGMPLERTFLYGIRIYNRGATLKMHRDRQDTHTFGVIVNLRQRVRREWPLVIEDNYYRHHDVILQPSEILLYEGTRLLHGRPTPFDGDHYVNIFCHYRPL